MEDEAPKPWRWPAAWLNQESFWRDVGSQAVSGLITAIVIVLIACIVGVGDYTPALRYYVLLSAIVAVIGALAWIVVAWLERLDDELTGLDGKEWRAKVLSVIGHIIVNAIFLALGVCALLALFGLLQWIAGWVSPYVAAWVGYQP